MKERIPCFGCALKAGDSLVFVVFFQIGRGASINVYCFMKEENYGRNNNLQLYLSFQRNKRRSVENRYGEVETPAKRMLVDMQSGKKFVCPAYRITKKW